MRTIFTDPDARAAVGFYLMPGPVQHTLDPELLARLVPLRVLGYELANPSRGEDRDEDDGERRKTYRGPTVDSELRKAGITFEANRSLWHAYERETRRLAQIQVEADQDAPGPSNDADDHRSAA